MVIEMKLKLTASHLNGSLRMHVSNLFSKSFIMAAISRVLTFINWSKYHCVWLWTHLLRYFHRNKLQTVSREIWEAKEHSQNLIPKAMTSTFLAIATFSGVVTLRLGRVCFSFEDCSTTSISSRPKAE